MTDNKQHIKNLKKLKSFHNGSYGADIDRSIKALEQEDILDKIDEIITDALDKSTDQKESQTLRWVLDKISEVQYE